MKAIGFIGLGAMGGPMARNVLKGGYTLRVHDVVPEAAEALRLAGAEPRPSPARSPGMPTA